MLDHHLAFVVHEEGVTKVTMLLITICRAEGYVTPQELGFDTLEAWEQASENDKQRAMCAWFAKSECPRFAWETIYDPPKWIKPKAD